MISRVAASSILLLLLFMPRILAMAITPDNLQRVLDRSEGHDRLAGEIRQALAVIDGVLDDYG